MIGFAGEGGGSGHRNFLPGVLAGDGATPAGRGLWNGLAAKEYGVDLPDRESPGMEFPDGCIEFADGSPAVDTSAPGFSSVLTTEMFLLQQWPMVSLISVFRDLTK
jgi:hypothetical protein